MSSAAIQAEQLLRADPRARIGGDGLSATLSLSRFQLYRRIKASAGISPKQLAGKHRIERACALLRESDRPIAAIAHEIGLPDANYFARYFKIQTGLTPREYRQRHSAPPRELQVPESSPAPAPLIEELPTHLL